MNDGFDTQHPKTDADLAEISPIDGKSANDTSSKAGSFIKLIGRGPVNDSSSVQFQNQEIELDSPRESHFGGRSSNQSQPQIQPSTAYMDELLAKISTEKSNNNRNRPGKPDFSKPPEEKTGLNLNATQKPDFVRHSGLIRQQTANLTGFERGRPPNYNAGRHSSVVTEEKEEDFNRQDQNIDLHGSLDESDIQNGAFRKRLARASQPLRVGGPVNDQESEIQWHMDSQSQMDVLLDPDDVNLDISHNASPETQKGGVLDIVPSNFELSQKNLKKVNNKFDQDKNSERIIKSNRSQDSQKKGAKSLPSEKTETFEYDAKNSYQLVSSIYDKKIFSIGVFVVRVIGVFILAVNLILDTSYAFLSTFASTKIFNFYNVLLAVRYVIPLFVLGRNCMYKLNEQKEEQVGTDLKKSGSGQNKVKENYDYQKQGYFLHCAIPFCYLLGTHRLLNFKNEASEMGGGLLIDFFVAATAFMMTQIINHGFLSTDATDAGQIYEFTQFQSAAVAFKFILIADLIIEGVLYSIELSFFNKFKAARIKNKQAYKLTEQDRRSRFGGKYLKINIIGFCQVLFMVVILSSATQRQICQPYQTISSSNDLVCINCAVNDCASCQVGGHEQCDACRAGYFLLQTSEKTECVDSTCQIDQCALCESQGPFKCDSCAPGFFLSAQGHCQSKVCTDAYCRECDTYGAKICDQCLNNYKFNKATGQCDFAPCKQIDGCKECQPNSAECDTCLSGYIFDKDERKCVVGETCDVQGCQTCFDAAVCDICERGLWLDSLANECIDGTCETSECKVCQLQGPAVCDSCNDGFALVDGQCKTTACPDGFEYNLHTNVCEDKICKVDFCGLCESAGVETCDRCKRNFWLTDENTCIDATCSDPGCGLCNIVGPSECHICKNDFLLTSTKTCQTKTCQTGYQWNDLIEACEDVTCKIQNCRTCALSGILGCDTCEEGYQLDATTQTCIIDPCKDTSCATCNPILNQCEACSFGYSLNADKKCVDATCTDTNCQTCWSGGPEVCDVCKENFLLQDNKCVSTVCDQPGYFLNYKTLLCEDLSCSMPNCSICTTGGPSICDKCDDGFVYKPLTNKCIADQSCQVSHCNKCETNRESCESCDIGFNIWGTGDTCVDANCAEGTACVLCSQDPGVCEECATGFWLDKTTSKCVDATCQIQGCADCSISGPSSCDLCQPGFLLEGNDCRGTQCQAGFRFDPTTKTCIDTVCKVQNCNACVSSGLFLCDQCNRDFIVSLDKTQCVADTSCTVDFCRTCLADRNVCEGCDDKFWLDQAQNECVDATCQTQNCILCDSDGPSVCEVCEPGYTLADNKCVDTNCPSGFVFNEQSAKCEDTVCKIESCERCDQSGIWDCDQCITDYLYHWWVKQCVFDSSCRVAGCADCSDDVHKCKACEKGLWFDATENECVACTADGCLECYSATACTLCEDGRTLQDGVCKGCSKTLCTACDETTGLCPKCRAGGFLEDDGATCTACPAGCPECNGPDSCLQCDGIKHVRIQPLNGECFCDTTKGWQTDANNRFDCVCTNDWLSSFGDCTNCETAFQGCRQCQQISANDTESFTGGLQVVTNKFADPGTYICQQCSISNTFFNYETGFCMECDRDVSGCQECGSDGSCTACLPKYALQANGGCFDCTWHSTGCEECTEVQCIRCAENYVELAGWCVPVPL